MRRHPAYHLTPLYFVTVYLLTSACALTQERPEKIDAPSCFDDPNRECGFGDD